MILKYTISMGLRIKLRGGLSTKSLSQLEGVTLLLTLTWLYAIQMEDLYKEIEHDSMIQNLVKHIEQGESIKKEYSI